MANAIKKISTARGYDVSGYTLVTFGGAGGQHACSVADALGMDRILIHPLAGVLSAYGIGLAELRALRESSVEKPMDKEGVTQAGELLDQLEHEAREELHAQHSLAETIVRKFHVRYRGTNTPLAVDAGSIPEMREAFQMAHQMRFGFVMDPDERCLMIDSVSVEAISGTENRSEHLPKSRDSAEPGPIAEVNAVFAGRWRPTPVFERERMASGTNIEGPAIIIERTATTVVEPGWKAEITPRLDLLLRRAQPRATRVVAGVVVDPILLEIFNNLFMSVAEQMGAVLQNTAYSVNIKERLDFSCALFDAEGRLVANAPHVPVHLGSMGEAVRAIIQRRKDEIRPGNVYALNDPFAGGTHLPDITVVTPVFDDRKQLLFWVASRGHHADVGGVTPGSMPPDSQTIDEEGVLITDFPLVEHGHFREEAFVRLLTSARYPARNVQQNLGDVHAQIAANEKGVRELAAMVKQFGLEVVQAYMGHVRANAAEGVRRVIDRLNPGYFVQKMDSGAEIRVRIDVDPGARRATIDFSGSSPQVPDNFNAPPSIVRAAVLYVFRTLVKEDIPLNDGCLEALNIVVPEGSMLQPKSPAAVVAGNVETSQAITNTLYGALGVLAAGQGTMNNLTFGNSRYQYYETICGGAGAGCGFCGASAVHTHMTNTRLTDPEILESHYPVLLESFQIRRGSGGAGFWRGGEGVIRKIRFRESMSVAILANHRLVRPFGLEGGGSGQVGRTYICRGDGRIEGLASCSKTEVNAGDQVVVETPGGGGFGVPVS
ncbi:MAG TPA: hydantoinase B/oxoprolinase family protein [Silvibacterium sp.]|nr:hydantoinase B/oxoprolinase family protein [Silvibacterium sp.]